MQTWTTFFTYGTAITQYTYVEGPPPLYILYASPEQTKQDQYQDTLEAAGDKGQRIKELTKVNECKQCMEGYLQDYINT